jgi:hypothetical protein
MRAYIEPFNDPLWSSTITTADFIVYQDGIAQYSESIVLRPVPWTLEFDD